MLDPLNTDIESLLDQAEKRRVIYYNNVGDETITLQIGRVVYTMNRERAVSFLQDVLAHANSTAPKATLLTSEN